MSDDKIALKHDGWVVVADGGKALYLRNEGDEKFPNLQVFREDEQENPPDRQQGTDKPGRFNDGRSVHRSAVQETDWHQLQEDRFAKEIAERLYKYAFAGRFDQLVIVAAPQVLGVIRPELHKEVSERLVAEIDKDLTNHPVEKIEKLILQSDAG